jgi:hypothetical protein
MSSVFLSVVGDAGEMAAVAEIQAEGEPIGRGRAGREGDGRGGKDGRGVFVFSFHRRRV